MKSVVISLFILFTFFLLPFQIVTLAQEEKMIATPEAQLIEQVDSFALFWPISAGKTVDDTLFPLKKFKENMRGLLIFSSPKKAEYQLFLATKRFLEAEKLLKESKNDQMLKSLDLGLEKLASAKSSWEKARNANAQRVNEMTNIATKIDNLNKLIAYYENTTDGDIKSKLGNVKTALEELKKAVQ